MDRTDVEISVVLVHMVASGCSDGRIASIAGRVEKEGFEIANALPALSDDDFAVSRDANIVPPLGCLGSKMDGRDNGENGTREKNVIRYQVLLGFPLDGPSGDASARADCDDSALCPDC